MSKFKGFVYGGPVPGSAGFYFGQGGGGPGICSGASPALVHVNFVNSRFYTRTSGQVGITSNDFADLLTFTGAPGREYIDANGDTVVVGLNEPRIGSYIDIGSGLFDAGIRFNSGNGEAMKIDAPVLARTIGSPGPELPLKTAGSATWDDETKTATYADATYGVIATDITDGEVILVSGNLSGGVNAELKNNDGDTYPLIHKGDGNFEALVVGINGLGLRMYTNYSGAYVAATISNLRVRKVTMPAAVSIAIEGYMTYADLDSSTQVLFTRWLADGNNFIETRLHTGLPSSTGDPFFLQSSSGAVSSKFTNTSPYAPGTNVPFSLASRHGATFINGAYNGNVLTEDTTPTSLPDIIASNFQIAPTFNGNITSLTIWADDITDTGIQAATTDGSGFNPLCPFDG